VDFSKAEEMGEKWRNDSFQKIDTPEDIEGKIDGF
jgi:hypothetical protein